MTLLTSSFYERVSTLVVWYRATWCILQPKFKNLEKIYSEKVSYIPGKWNFLALILKFSQKKAVLIFRKTETQKKEAFLIFRETETTKNFFTFQETEFPYITGSGNRSGNGSVLYFRKVTFQAWKIKKSLLTCLVYLGKWNFLPPGFKKFILYFRRNFQNPKNKNFLYFSSKSYE